ncbi:MAG: phenylalanine--tRNA ligase subunit beta, partial [Patescibacteria group bacterium]
MLISLNWLKQYVDLTGAVTAEDLKQKLTLSTVEVEGFEDQAKNLEGIVVGKVLKAEKHPNADKLKVCQVDIGHEKLQIVCGGSNVYEGMLAAVAKIGAKVRWHGAGELVVMESAKIRDVESFGMICASTEIGLGELFPLKNEKEILDLTKFKYKVGMPLARALGLDDIILEVDNKSLSNRPDLWGHYGLAREVAALYKRRLEDYKTKKINPGKEIDLQVKVEDNKLCPRYMAVALGGIKVAESPLWLKQALVKVGLRPINNIVDITNYIMFDLGQPMHAFDAAKLNPKSEIRNPKQIVVRRAKDGEKFETLDGEKKKLDSSMLVIATDDERPLALAGVIGGVDSGITEETTEIIFESANFDPASIRKTSTKLGVRTDSSARFEKSLDPNWCQLALERAVEMALELCPGAKVISRVADEKHFHLKTGPVVISLAAFHKKIGVEILKKTIVDILEHLGFGVRQKTEALSITIPTWRATKDIAMAEDIIEEVLRIYGYDKIESSLPKFPIAPPEVNLERQLQWQASDCLVKNLAYSEMSNYAFVSAVQIKKMGDSLDTYLELDNPLSKEKPFLRRYLLTNLLENAERNLANEDELKLFEVGKVFLAEKPGPRMRNNRAELLPRQDTWLAALYTAKKDNEPFWGARRAVENIFQTWQKKWELVATKDIRPWEHPVRLGKIKVGNEEVGQVFELNPSVAEKFGINTKVGIVEINLTKLAELKKEKQVFYESVPAYPDMERDLALVVAK